MREGFSVIEVKENKTKSTYTREILESLPEWFGNKQALEEYVEKVRELPYWAAMDENNKCIGFFSIKTHYEHTGEIFVCGILPEAQHKGVGKALYNAVESYFIKSGCKYAMAKTRSDRVESESYEQTRRFYKSIGFEPLVTLTEMWDEENPCLIMIKQLI